MDISQNTDPPASTGRVAGNVFGSKQSTVTVSCCPSGAILWDRRNNLKYGRPSKVKILGSFELSHIIFVKN